MRQIYAGFLLSIVHPCALLCPSFCTLQINSLLVCVCVCMKTVQVIHVSCCMIELRSLIIITGSRSTRAKPLHWTSCLKIADDVVQGLAHIHQSSCLIHGNIKSSNILLGSDFEACLTDSCLSFLLEPSDNQNDSGYRAPEARNSLQELTPSSDIYAFGVLLLELLTGKPPLQHPVLIPPDLPVWVRSVREDGACDERLMMIIDIAAACIHSSPECRPTTWQVLKMIQEVKETDTGDNDTDSTFIS